MDWNLILDLVFKMMTVVVFCLIWYFNNIQLKVNRLQQKVNYAVVKSFKELEKKIK